MFEKSLYDLIKGLRSHKGNEKDYIEHCLRECRQEIRGSDMDLKATALLKLVYLEMFGHDMSWASFNILEVMSASKYHQKRVGYLGAVQSFGPNTDVLMLATNLLKKDITSSSVPTISLPLVTIPHLVTPGLASSVVPDLMARMAHRSPNVRKKSVTTLYRLALTWPEALRPAWPKMKEILENEDEDPSVIAAVVNVICELVWRRPEDFLALAPRFFDLLIHGGNNWMAIKIIKLFATLTPMEPRLIRKLAPALTNLIRTTPAMSVLYECIQGIIQGGILDGSQGIQEGDEIAELCVSKLCGMIAVDGDPNLKYVALLAFNKIVLSHPQLVSIQQEVIVSCLDDNDISIRTQALDLVSGMVDANNLTLIVEKLLLQLSTGKQSHPNSQELDITDRRNLPSQPEHGEFGRDPAEYRSNIVRNVIEMCSRSLYANVTDFDWYIDVLVELAKLAPPHVGLDQEVRGPYRSQDVFTSIGTELRNIAVRVKAARLHAVEVASTLISALGQHELLMSVGAGGYRVLEHAAFLAGEYPGLLPDAQETLNALVLPTSGTPLPETSSAYIQAITKVLTFILATELVDWNHSKQIMTGLLLARVTIFLEGFVHDAHIEIQESAVTALEIMRLADAALSKHSNNALVPPQLLVDIIPSLFHGQELNPVSSTAQAKVPLPVPIKLDDPINHRLTAILYDTEDIVETDRRLSAVDSFYYQKDSSSTVPKSAVPAVSQLPYFGRHDENEADSGSEIRIGTDSKAPLRKSAYDPFYIGANAENPSETTTPMHEIIQDTNGRSLDIDSIPIVELDLGHARVDTGNATLTARKRTGRSLKAKAQVLGDETLEEPERAGALLSEGSTTKLGRHPRVAKLLLGIDSSSLGPLSSSLEPGQSIPSTAGQSFDHEVEMKKALAEVERLRLEMQRAQERVISAEDTPTEGTLIVKRKKKKSKKGATVSNRIKKAHAVEDSQPLNPNESAQRNTEPVEGYQP